MQCDDLDELAGAFALGALPDEERREALAHLESCPLPHAGLHQSVEVAALLPLVLDDVAPPLLGPRILAAIRAEGVPPAVSGPEVGGEDTLHRAGATERRAGASGRVNLRLVRARRSLAPFALAAAMLVLLLGLGLWGLGQRGVATRRQARIDRDSRVLAAVAAGDQTVRIHGAGALADALLVQPHDGGAAYLVVAWPRAAAGKTYEAWFISGGKPVSAGVFDGSGGSALVVQLTRPLDGAQAVAFTLENQGGAEQPSTTPLVQGGVS